MKTSLPAINTVRKRAPVIISAATGTMLFAALCLATSSTPFCNAYYGASPRGTASVAGDAGRLNAPGAVPQTSSPSQSQGSSLKELPAIEVIDDAPSTTSSSSKGTSQNGAAQASDTSTSGEAAVSSYVWTCGKDYGGIAPDDGSLSEWAPHYFVAHSYGSFGQAILGLKREDQITINGNLVTVEGFVVMPKYSYYNDVMEAVGWDATVFQTCIPDSNSCRFVYARGACSTAKAAEEARAWAGVDTQNQTKTETQGQNRTQTQGLSQVQNQTKASSQTNAQSQSESNAQSQGLNRMTAPMQDSTSRSGVAAQGSSATVVQRTQPSAQQSLPNAALPFPTKTDVPFLNSNPFNVQRSTGANSQRGNQLAQR